MKHSLKEMHEKLNRIAFTKQIAELTELLTDGDATIRKSARLKLDRLKRNATTRLT